MGCAPILKLVQHTGELGELGKMEEEAVQDEHHSDHSLHVSEEEVKHRQGVTHQETDQVEEHCKRVKWPPASNEATSDLLLTITG